VIGLIILVILIVAVKIYFWSDTKPDLNLPKDTTDTKTAETVAVNFNDKDIVLVENTAEFRLKKKHANANNNEKADEKPKKS